MDLAFTHVNVITGRDGHTLRNATVVVRGTRLASVDSAPPPEGIPAIDVAGKTIMPGLIDCHYHHAPWFQWPVRQIDHHLMYLASRTAYALRAMLEEGFTSVRDMGGLEAGFREALEQGLIPGPRVQTAITIIQPTYGLTDNYPGLSPISADGHYVKIPGIPLQWCDGPEGARQKVREVLRAGADLIKIAQDGYHRGKGGRPLFTSAELGAIVDEAHRNGVKVGAHAYTPPAVLACVRAGVDCIEEGHELDEECAREMAKKGTWYIPCGAVLWKGGGNPEAARQWADREAFQSRVLAYAVKEGVRIAMGSDMTFRDRAGGSGTELVWMCRAGMTPMQTIEAATRRGAECMGIDDQVGTLEAGKEADLLVVNGDPLKDISILADPTNLAMVMKGGKPVAGPLSAGMIEPAFAQPKQWTM